MMEELTMFEAGTIDSEGSYSKFMHSPHLPEATEYLIMMDASDTDYFQLVIHEKTYHCVSTVPYIIHPPIENKLIEGL
jgi:hypothetical protein